MRDAGTSPPGSIPDLAALAELFESHRAKLLAMLQRRLDPSLAARLDAEDLLSETFLEARRRWPDYRRRPAASPYVWLYGLARERLIAAWRRATRLCRDARSDLPWPARSSVQLGMGLVADGTTPEEAAERREVQDRMARALARLPDRDREILWMRHYDELTFREAAEALGVTESAATLRYVRALKRLRALWDEAGGDA